MGGPYRCWDRARWVAAAGRPRKSFEACGNRIELAIGFGFEAVVPRCGPGRGEHNHQMFGGIDIEKLAIGAMASEGMMPARHQPPLIAVARTITGIELSR